MAYNHLDRLDLGRQRFRQLSTEMLVYARGGLSVEIHGFTTHKVDVNLLAMHGISLIHERMQDFVFEAAKLSKFPSQRPIEGDTITWNGIIYTVNPMGEELYTYITSKRTSILVHTKETGSCI